MRFDIQEIEPKTRIDFLLNPQREEEEGEREGTLEQMQDDDDDDDDNQTCYPLATNDRPFFITQGNKQPARYSLTENASTFFFSHPKSTTEHVEQYNPQYSCPSSPSSPLSPSSPTPCPSPPYLSTISAITTNPVIMQLEAQCASITNAFSVSTSSSSFPSFSTPSLSSSTSSTKSLSSSSSPSAPSSPISSPSSPSPSPSPLTSSDPSDSMNIHLDNIIKNSKRKNMKTMIIRDKHLLMRQTEAAIQLGFSSSTFSKRWRDSVPERKWPYRKHSKLVSGIKVLKRMLGRTTQDLYDRNRNNIEKDLARMLKERNENMKPAVIYYYEKDMTKEKQCV